MSFLVQWKSKITTSFNNSSITALLYQDFELENFFFNFGKKWQLFLNNVTVTLYMATVSPEVISGTASHLFAIS